MPVGDRAILEITVDRLVESGITDITLCVGYLAHLIEARVQRPAAGCAAFDTSTRRRRWAPRARFVWSTISTDTFLLMNGDLLTDLEFPDADRGPPPCGQRRHDRDPRAKGHDRLRRPPCRRGRVAAPRPLRGEARDRVDGQHGDLRARAVGRWSTCRTGYFDFPDLDSRACSTRDCGSGPSRSPASGSTSAGVTTTSRRSRSGRSERPTPSTE